MASLKLVQDNERQDNNLTADKPQSIVFNPLTGKSPVEAEQKESMFLSPETEAKSQLTAGQEFLIIKKTD